MFRFTFYRIPFMRGGTRVPALAAGSPAVSALEKYKKAEVVTRLQFSETQAQAVINNGDTLADSGANYMRVARTTSETVGDYSTDTAAAFYWVDDIQLLAAAEGATPAALVSFTPDPWLTDFYASESAPTVHGRIAQTTYTSDALESEIRTVDAEPVGFGAAPPTVWGYLENGGTGNFYSPVATGANYRVCVTCASENGEIFGYESLEVYDRNNVLKTALQVSRIASVKVQNPPQTYNLSVLKIYILPQSATPNIGEDKADLYGTDGLPLPVTMYPMVPATDLRGGSGSATVTEPETPFKPLFAPQVRKFLCTPKRAIELKTINFIGGGSTKGYAVVARLFVRYSRESMSDALQIMVIVNGELVDVSDDFTVDFAVNEELLRQSQQKELYALQAISNALGAAGGVVGGLSSGNYFGAVQAAAGGISGLVSPRAAARTPATVKGDGSASIAVGQCGLLSLVLYDDYGNAETIAASVEKYGYVFENAPRLDFDTRPPAGNYYQFATVEVSGTTGGQLSQLEIADAFRRGVRLVEL